MKKFFLIFKKATTWFVVAGALLIIFIVTSVTTGGPEQMSREHPVVDKFVTLAIASACIAIFIWLYEDEKNSIKTN